MDEKLLVPADPNTMLSFGRTECHLIALIRFMSPDLKGKQHSVFVNTKPTRGTIGHKLCSMHANLLWTRHPKWCVAPLRLLTTRVIRFQNYR